MIDKNTQIIEAAIRLFAGEGISVPTAKIAKEAGVSNGTLFNYFVTKQDLIDAVYLFMIEKIASEVVTGVEISATMKEILSDVWTSYIAWAEKHPLEHQVLDLLKTSQKLSDDVKAKGENFFASIDEVMENGVANKTIIDVPTEYLCEVAGALLGATISHAQSNNLNKQQLNDLITKSFEIYWNGIQRI